MLLSFIFVFFIATGKRVVKVRRSSSPADYRNEEAIRMSVFPSAKPKPANEPDKIERDDWPGPASPAAILSEICKLTEKYVLTLLYQSKQPCAYSLVILIVNLFEIESLG